MTDQQRIPHSTETRTDPDDADPTPVIEPLGPEPVSNPPSYEPPTRPPADPGPLGPDEEIGAVPRPPLLSAPRRRALVRPRAPSTTA